MLERRSAGQDYPDIDQPTPPPGDALTPTLTFVEGRLRELGDVLMPGDGAVRIQRITVRNHARLVDLDISVRGHLVIVGANDVGKTSLLRLLNLTLGPTAQLYQQLTVDDLRDSDEKLVVDIQFTDFTDEEKRHFHREIDIHPDDKTESLRIRLTVEIDPDDAESVTALRWCPGRGEVRNLSREQIETIGWRYLPALRQMTPASFDGPNGIVHALLDAVETDLGEEKAELNSLRETINERLSTSPTLTRLREGMSDHLSRSMPRAIVADALAVRMSAHPDDSVLDNVSMYFVRDGEFTPLSKQSDGIRQLISMTLFDLAEDTANVIAIDEPETHLHPQSQRTVAELLAGGRNQKILVTHSPYIVQRFDPAQIVTITADSPPKQLTDPARAVTARSQALWWNPKMLEALTARYVIAVEGAADQILVEAAARARRLSLDRIGAVVFNLDGADKFRDVYAFLGRQGFGIDILGLVDDDAKGKWQGAIGESPNRVYDRTLFVSCKDLEDEYCAGLGTQTIATRLIAARVARDERALTSSCETASIDDTSAEDIAAYCRKNKIPAALAVREGLTQEEARRIGSIDRMLDELERRAGQ